MSAPPTGSDAMKAVLTDARFSDPAWIFERKLDGVRCIAVRDGDDVQLYSRNDLSMNARYPEIAEALAGEPATRFAIDGEVVAFDGDATSFALLARRGQEPVDVFYYVFDLLWLDGEDLTARPLRERKQLLKTTLTFPDHVRFTQHRNTDGEAFYTEACQQGWEGLIAKRADSLYVPHGRSKDWLKFKCGHGQELVIGGYTAPKGSRIEFGALLLGVYDGDRLRYAGKVGTGFDAATLQALGAELRARHRDSSPFADQVKEPRTTWVEPELVAQIGFAEWTRDGRLRHPRFLGLRDDKRARDVVREG